MKENKIENLTPIKTIESQIWEMFDILRNNSIGSNEYPIILLFLSLYRDDQISKDFLFGDSQLNYKEPQILDDTIFDKPENDYSKIIDCFSSSLVNIRNKGFKELIEALFKIDKVILKREFSVIFDSTLYRITNSQGRFGGEFIQPVEITRLMCAIADLPKNSKIYNPFAGLASFGVFLNQGHDYFGQELNQTTWALGALRIMAYQKPDTINYVHDDSILHWPKEPEKFDLVIANPPYGMRLSHQKKEIEPGIRTIEQFLIEKGMNSLNEKGKLIALIPHGFLFRGMQDQRLRKYLVEKDLIDSIISLPSGLLTNIGIPLIILVIDKNKKLPGKVRFIDAKTFVESKNSKQKVLNDSKLLKYFSDSNKDKYEIIDGQNLVNEPLSEYSSLSTNRDTTGISKIERIVPINQIIEFDYNLNVPRYFQKQIEGVKLKEIVEIVRGKRGKLPDKGKRVGFKDLKNDQVDYNLDVPNIEETELRKFSLRQIDKSSLLIATRWKTLKPTLFKFTGTPIFLQPDIISFKVDENLVDIGYLINELQADYVEEQLESYRQGAAIPMIRKDDLLEIVIKLPTLEEQRAKIQGITELSNKIKLLQQERNALAHGKEIGQFNEFASLKHTLGRPRQNILDWTDNLFHFFNEKPDGFDALNNTFLDFYETDILSALKEIKHDVNFMTEVLEKGENGFVLKEFDKTIISLSQVNGLINELSNNGLNFKIKKLVLIGEKLKERGIYGNKTLLKTLLDNLLTNAHKYGFVKKATGNEVVIELKEIDDFLSIEVRNNGKSFPKNFDREKFITKYSTAETKSGTGLGGYDIHRIATEFNNPEWDLTLDEDPIYPVKFNFRFTIKLIN
ncbi:N-6 DNA methylase [Maribacter sp. M208]|uniref:N-6 DNA methylase n=1 Tax=Maribacter huludaoensis TaxID=3030010 RepID=UPI0023EDE472|nr:N-6 DNA methylase [Maribacter huludaoensis]MDF4221087.1 N-6 DNA methylase [Maribacter huludaoensis]